MPTRPMLRAMRYCTLDDVLTPNGEICHVDDRTGDQQACG
jgi:hypothetical protein